jgi:serine/threonine-protein kinase PRP4
VKATKTLPQFDGTSVDRPDRPRSISSASKSPEHSYRSRDRRSNERSRSPYSARGSKRSREDDYPDRSRDTRSFKVHYEDAPRDRRPRVSYSDIDQGTAPVYDDRDRYPQKRHRTRSRSPYRSNRNDDRNGDRNGRGGQSRRGGDRYNGYGDGGRPKSYSRGDVRSRDTKDQSVSNRGQSPMPAENARHEAKHTQGFSQQHNASSDKTLELKKYVSLRPPLSSPTSPSTVYLTDWLLGKKLHPSHQLNSKSLKNL